MSPLQSRCRVAGSSFIRIAMRTGLSDLSEFAARERRKLGNVAELILEWGFKQLKTAGSIKKLMKCGSTGRTLWMLHDERRGPSQASVLEVVYDVSRQVDSSPSNN
jgi:hypothetical protein